VLRFFGVLVSSFRRVTKEGGIAHAARRLLVLVSWIPREVRDKARFKNPIDRRFLTWQE
jgi:hypothetical protein